MRPTASADDRISLVTTHSRCKARRGLRSRGGCSRLPMRARCCCLLVRRDHRPTHQCKHVGTQLPSGAALPVPFAPRLLLCLRIKHPVTGLPARLNTRPVASGYLSGIRTRQTARHCQAATSGCFRLERSPGGVRTHWKSAAFSRRTPESANGSATCSGAWRGAEPLHAVSVPDCPRRRRLWRSRAPHEHELRVQAQ